MTGNFLPKELAAWLPPSISTFNSLLDFFFFVEVLKFNIFLLKIFPVTTILSKYLDFIPFNSL